MAKYDEAGDVKRRRISPSLISLFVGVVILIVGIVLVCIMDMDKYYKKVSISNDFESTNISNIDIDYGAGMLTFEKSSDDKIHVEGEAIPENVGIECDGDTFKITSNHFNWKNFWTFFRFGDSSYYSLTVYLPEKTYSDVKVNIGAGETNISDLSCKNADLDLGAGQVTFNNLKISEEADFNCGAGQITFNSCLIGEGDFDCGVGQIEYNGIITGDTDVNCGVGECDFNLQGDESNYRLTGDMSSSTDSKDAVKIKVSKGIGDVKFSYNNDFGL